MNKSPNECLPNQVTKRLPLFNRRNSWNSTRKSTRACRQSHHIFSLISNDSTVDTFVPEKNTVKQLFSQYLDSCGPPDRSLLRAFLIVANREGTDRINKMLDAKQEEEIKHYMKDANTCEFICEFAQYGIPSIELLISGCQHTKPRKYLISSSPLRNQNLVLHSCLKSQIWNQKQTKWNAHFILRTATIKEYSNSYFKKFIWITRRLHVANLDGLYSLITVTFYNALSQQVDSLLKLGTKVKKHWDKAL